MPLPSQGVMPLVTTITNRTKILLILLGIAVQSTIQCGQNPSTNNGVRTIEINAFDQMISNPEFSGLVVVMAAWCPPCREELPVIADLYRKYRQQGIGVVAVGIDAGGPKEIQPLVDKLKIPFPVYWTGPAATQHYRIPGIPFLMVVDKGRILEKIPGLHSRKSIEAKLRNLLTADS